MSKPLARSNTQNSRGSRIYHDKMRPTSSSPTQVSPTLTQSASNSSSSPPEPATPPRASRSRSRYPDHLGRVPLHRRGTSKTYERLEDLLKEAGYKETRIFTPETERAEANADRDGGSRSGDDRRFSGMEAVVGFFAGLMPSATTNKTSEATNESLTTSPQEYSPPISPLAHKYPQRNATRTSFSSTEPPTPTITSSIESLQDPTPNVTRQHISRSNSPAPTIIHRPSHYQQQPPLIIRTSSQLSYASHQMQKRPSRNSINVRSNNNIASPRPSRAGAYLRHMTSMSNMPERPNSTPVHLLNRPRIQLNDSDSEGASTYNRRGNGEGEGEDEPPLPPSWLETVARAVLFGGTGAYIGGPSNYAPTEPTTAVQASPKATRIQVLRPTRSSLSQVSARRLKHHQHPVPPRSGLSDHTNTGSSSGNTLVPPPPLFAKIERGRAGRSEGEVSKTRVVCRSAPGSRSGSVTRGVGVGEDRREKRNVGKARGRDRQKKNDSDRLPSLARTHAEGDVWSRSRQRPINNRHLSGWGTDVESDDNDEAGATPSSEDDDEGELNLARILVPPKRQSSIKSLRKHLAGESAGPSAYATLKTIAGAIIPGTRAAGRQHACGVTVVSGGPPSLAQRSSRPMSMEEDWDGESQQEWGGGWVKRSRGSRGSDDDDDDVQSFNGFFGEGRVGLCERDGSRKTRIGFNGPWGLSGGTG